MYRKDSFSAQFSGRRIWLIINEFGKVGVDGALLQEVKAVMAEITNGSIFCSCRLDRFEDELRRAVAAAPDVILVEASGLADPTNIQRVLSEKDFAKIRYKGSVCLVDVPRLEKVLYTARVCPKQIGISSLILRCRCLRGKMAAGRLCWPRSKSECNGIENGG